ncbi:MAG: YwbE family protein [Candidatus Wolfebacteria bacterium]|nr:YwbE family protein [Candidatus Wolfebacteria bacterium]
MNGQKREDVKIGSRVEVVAKADQKTGILTYGIVAEILTNSNFHPHGIKVRLEDGQVGRVQNIMPSKG